MAKRTATTELTDRNWDQEEEAEEAGEFSKASQDTLKTRNIIKAKRRNIGDQEAPKPGAFGGFSGFSFKPTQTSTPLMGFGGTKTESKIQEKRPAEPSKNEGSPGKQKKTETNGSDKNGDDSSSYLSSLRSLNVSVLNWISQHVEKNPYCILTPIFKDYEKHLTELEKDKAKSDKKVKPSKDTDMELTKEETVKTMETTEEKPAPKTGLTFGLGNLNTASSSLGAGAPATGFSGFSFKPTPTGDTAAAVRSPFSFSVGKSSVETGSAGTSGAEGSSSTQEEEEYVPPKPEVTEHKEEGSIYTKKCKLFYQKEGAWTERGIGHLHLKKLDDKAQLLVRADTTLGNILLNILLNSSIPMSRSGKNNVSMMCIPNPAIPKIPENKAIPFLIRVKTGDDADELLEKMKEIQS